MDASYEAVDPELECSRPKCIFLYNLFHLVQNVNTMRSLLHAIVFLRLHHSKKAIGTLFL